MPAQIRSILSLLDQKAISAQVRIESRHREVHLPPVSVYRWWARRTEAVNGAILDAAAKVLTEGGSLLVADPFAGGGVIPMSALCRGHRVYAQDLNPWVAQGLSTALTLPSPEVIERAGTKLINALKELSQEAYATTFRDGSVANTSHTFRVAVGACSNCGHVRRLFPHALVTLLRRKDRTVKKRGANSAYLSCPNGHLFRGRGDRKNKCPECAEITDPKATYLPKRISTCRSCGYQESLEQIASTSGLDWEVVLVERSLGSRREIGPPTEPEIGQSESVKWTSRKKLGAIPDAHETRVLRRHGFKTWNDLYTKRQIYVIESALALIDELTVTKSERNALRMAVLGTAEMAGMLSRWDRFYLKSYESMASHRFNFTTFTTEPNVIGINGCGRGSLVNRLAAIRKAADWLQKRAIDLPYSGPIQANTRKRRQVSGAELNVVCGSSERMLLADDMVDLILTDPPYHDDVQYHELSLPLRAWAGLPLGRSAGEAVAIPHSQELDGHKSYREQLAPIFSEFSRVLKPNGRLLFSYANREPAAWVNLFAALRDAKLRPLGFTIVHSENDVEQSKRQRRSCKLDLILELVPTSSCRLTRWCPKPVFHTEEEKYLLAVGSAFLESGSLFNGWEEELVIKLRSEPFVSLQTRTKIVSTDTHKSGADAHPQTRRQTRTRRSPSDLAATVFTPD